MFPEWMTKLSNGEAIHISDVSKIPDASTEKEMLVGQGIKSALVLPVMTAGTDSSSVLMTLLKYNRGMIMTLRCYACLQR